MGSGGEETKIIYHIGDEDTPYLIKLSIPANVVTLKDFKDALQKPNCKYFFKSMDDDFGVVKEEIIDDDAKLPCFNGRVVSWLVAADSSDTQSQNGGDGRLTDSPLTTSNNRVADGRPAPAQISQNLARLPPNGQIHVARVKNNAHDDDLEQEALDHFDEDTSTRVSSRREHRHRSNKDKSTRLQNYDAGKHGQIRNNGLKSHRRGYDTTSTITSSDLESTSFFDSEDDGSSRYSTVTGDTSVSSKYGQHRQRRRRHLRRPDMSRASSFSSITDSTMSLNVITVTLNMDTVSFLGISIVGQSNKGGDGGIYVGSIMKGGAVALDGRIEPGDMILEVNGVSFENLSNDDAVRTLREAVQKPGPITLVVAKCWDPSPKGYFTIPRQEPVRPIDPSAWVAHTTALQQQTNLQRGQQLASSLDTMSTLTSSSLSSSMPDSQRSGFMGHVHGRRLTVDTPMPVIVRAVSASDSGLEIRDRLWLKISIPNAFIGSELVDWLYSNVEGFTDRRDARKYATSMLKEGFIRHTVNKLSFSEQCYYIFGDLSDALSSLSMSDDLRDSVSERAENLDILQPLPPPQWNNTMYSGYSGYTSQPSIGNYLPPPYSYVNDAASYQTSSRVPGSATSQNSSGSSASGSSRSKRSKEKEKYKANSGHSSSESDSIVSVQRRGLAGKYHDGSERSFAMTDTTAQSLPPPPADLGSIPVEVSGSKQSFRQAMGNPCAEFFVDVM